MPLWTADAADLAWQFIRYALCGLAATAIDSVVFFLMSWRVLPALRPDDPTARRWGLPVRPVTEEQRASRFLVNNAVAFAASNLSGYLMNVAWVFVPGRHPPALELALFFGVSAVSMAIGACLGWLLIRAARWGTTPAYAVKIAASVLINFAGRKWVVFSG